MGDEGDEVGRHASIRVDLRIYRLAAVKKTAYGLADRATAELQYVSDDQLDVRLRFKRAQAERDIEELTRVFFQELLDQELREHIAEETGPVRSLILAHAFSKADLIKRG